MSANSNDEKVSATDIKFNNNEKRRFSKTTSAMLQYNKVQEKNAIINKVS